jgi:hypothetical protein
MTGGAGNADRILGVLGIEAKEAEGGRPMYPIAIYPPVKQLDDRDARLRTRPRPGAGERVALRWRPVRFG